MHITLWLYITRRIIYLFSGINQTRVVKRNHTNPFLWSTIFHRDEFDDNHQTYHAMDRAINRVKAFFPERSNHPEPRDFLTILKSQELGVDNANGLAFRQLAEHAFPGLVLVSEYLIDSFIFLRILKDAEVAQGLDTEEDPLGFHRVHRPDFVVELVKNVEQVARLRQNQIQKGFLRQKLLQEPVEGQVREEVVHELRHCKHFRKEVDDLGESFARVLVLNRNKCSQKIQNREDVSVFGSFFKKSIENYVFFLVRGN